MAVPAHELERLAATHSDACAPTCPLCLARDLQAKARVVRAETLKEVVLFLERQGYEAAAASMRAAYRIEVLSG